MAQRPHPSELVDRAFALATRIAEDQAGLAELEALMAEALADQDGHLVGAAGVAHVKVRPEGTNVTLIPYLVRKVA